MKYEEIVADLKAGKYAPIYFLSGEESYFLDDIATRIEKNALTEDEKAFNQTILYGNDVSMTTVTDTARRFPMMSQRQVVIVKERPRISGISRIYCLILIIFNRQRSSCFSIKTRNRINVKEFSKN